MRGDHKQGAGIQSLFPMMFAMEEWLQKKCYAMSFMGRMISGGVKPVLLVCRLQRCCSLGRLPWRPEIDSGLFSCCQNRKQKEKTEEVNRRCPGGWCNQSHVDWWTSCRRGMELGFDEKQAGDHASSSCLSFLLANAWLCHQSQNSDLASIWCQHRVKINFEEECCPRG